MTKTARDILHNFALTYRVESKESRKQCLDQALKELEAIIGQAEPGTWVDPDDTQELDTINAGESNENIRLTQEAEL